jgi:aspartate-semialdehyde dehydrogenase
MKICILGATGLVGDELLTLIDRAWPDAELILFASRAREIERHGKRYQVHAATDLETEGAPKGDLAFVALDDEYSKRFCPRLLELGYRVIDKSNTYRMDPKVVLGVAGVNHDLVSDEVRLVANPNCTTIPFTLAVQPLLSRWGLASATVSSYQAISGAGAGTLDAFIANSAAGYAESSRIGDNFDPNKYAGNCVPHNGKTDESGFSSEERKLMNESRKILRAADAAVSAQCCRVPVAVGHYENIWLTLERSPAPGELEQAWEGAPFVRYLPGAAGEGLSALATVHARDLTLVGRLRKDARDASGRSWCLTVAADNLRLGAATNAVRLASAWFGGADPDLRV